MKEQENNAHEARTYDGGISPEQVEEKKKKHRKVNVCDLGNELRKEIPNFSTFDYGFAKFKSFLRSFRFLKFESHKGKKTIVTMDSHYRVQYE